MKLNSKLKKCVVAALLAGFMGAAIAEDRTPSDEALAANAAEAQRIAALASITNNRYDAIAGIVAIWRPQVDGDDAWEAEFTTALNNATDQQLYNIQSASSYDAIVAILQGSGCTCRT